MVGALVAGGGVIVDRESPSSSQAPNANTKAAYKTIAVLRKERPSSFVGRVELAGARMGLVVDLADVLVGKLGVDLGGGDVGMPE